MYTNQLIALNRLDKKMRPHFAGVYACNMVANMEFRKKCKTFLIVNASPAREAGDHWVLFFNLGNDNPVIFFDSLGKTPQDYGDCMTRALLHFTLSSNFPNHADYNPTVLQSTTSRLCGAYCLYVAHHLCKGKGINMMMMSFSEDKNKNDSTVLNWFRKWTISMQAPAILTCI